MKSNITTDCNHQLCSRCCQYLNKTKTCYIHGHDITDFLS